MLKTFFLGLVAVVSLLCAAVGVGSWVWLSKLESDLPSVQSLRDPDLGAPLRVFSADGKLLGEFGAERRSPLSFDQFPPRLVKAFLAAEDDQFYQHQGVDYAGLVRAVVSLVMTGEKRQGGSTITMQLARGVFLTNERSYERKVREILLARRMEDELTKNQILEIYLNRIFMGNRAYGVAAAANVYFGKALNELSLSEMAVLAALPKAPSQLNPISNPRRSLERRNYVLRRMLELNMISQREYQTALAEPIAAHEHVPVMELDAAYVGEMVRAELFARFGEAAYTAGYRVTTTIDSKIQDSANRALRRALLDYEQRHGFEGPEAKAEGEALNAITSGAGDKHPAVQAFLKARPTLANLPAAVVLERRANGLAVYSRERGVERISPEGSKWLGPAADKLAPGDVVRLRLDGEVAVIVHRPRAQAAFVSMDSSDGAITAVVGGYDFYAGKFNRVTQAKRQAGSGFKPFVYAAALARRYTPASVFLDAPYVVDAPGMERAWRPMNYDGKFKGPMRMREALVQSRNLVSIRVLESTGMRFALDYAARFGFEEKELPRNLTLSLGTASLTPLQMARGYATLANGGFLITPYFIKRIEGARGEVIDVAKPLKACPECPPEITAADEAAQLAPRTVDPDTRYMITSILHDVTVRGTAAELRKLERDDLAGKTGTSNDETDAWFNGFQYQGMVATAWVGYDQPAPLGKGEVGGRAALPIWRDAMAVALKDVPVHELIRPAHMVPLRIARGGGTVDENGEVIQRYITEWIPPDRMPAPSQSEDSESQTEAGEAAEELF